MSGSSWSIRTSAGRQFSAAVTGFLVVAGVVMSLMYRTIVANELDEELMEQVADVRAGLPPAEIEIQGLIAAVASTTHPELETPLAWRLTAPGLAEGAKEQAVGSPELLGRMVRGDGEQESGTVWRPSAGTRQVRVDLGSGIQADVLMDGQEWMARTRLFALSFAAVAALGSLFSLFVGRIFGGRVSQMVSRVAEDLARGSESGELFPERASDAPQEVRAVSEAIEARLEALMAEMERSRTLVAGLAHDLRAPVQALLTSTQVALLEHGEPAQDPRAMLQRHLAELRGLARTVDNILEWGAPRHAGTGDAAVPFHLGQELRDRLLGEEEAAARAGVFMDRMELGDLSYVGSPDSIVLAIRNLVGNAIAWCPAGGEVSLELEGLPEAVVVRVRDDGPGVPESEAERIFEPFVRGAAAPGRRAGYGLGLAIVRSVAARHGGSVRVQGAPDAAFILTLPRPGPRPGPGTG